MLVAVSFDPVDEDGRAVLQVEAPDRPGMLLTITRELFQQGAQITRSLVRTADGRAYNRFELSEFSGHPLSADRREQVRAAVVAALAFGDDEQASRSERSGPGIASTDNPAAKRAPARDRTFDTRGPFPYVPSRQWPLPSHSPGPSQARFAASSSWGVAWRG